MILLALLLCIESVSLVDSFGIEVPLLQHHRWKILSSTTTILSTPDTSGGDAAAPAYGLYEVQEELLVKTGIKEESLMANNHSPLKASKPKGVGGGGGFGKKSSGGNNLKAEGKLIAKVLQKEGVVRIDNVLPKDAADCMKEYVTGLRQRSEQAVAEGSVKSFDRFADVLLRKNRCDLKIPLGPDPVLNALEAVLCNSPVRHTIESLLTSDAQLYELSCLISDPGSQRQVVHPDNPYLERDGLKENEPILLTCFVALQDIEEDMGPTVWIPRTHNQKSHEKFKDDDDSTGESAKDKLLRTKQSVLGLLSKGSCVIYDSRVLHCGTKNESKDKSRALFYFSFKNPKIGYPGNPASIGYQLNSAGLSISELSDEVQADRSGRGSQRLKQLAFLP